MLSWTGSGREYETSFSTKTDATQNKGVNPSKTVVLGLFWTAVFSDMNNGLNIVDAIVGPLQPVKQEMPESTNLLAPKDFSRFAVATGLDPMSNGFVTYDNLFWPNGSP